MYMYASLKCTSVKFGRRELSLTKVAITELTQPDYYVSISRKVFVIYRITCSINSILELAVYIYDFLNLPTIRGCMKCSVAPI
jgi:hypothetical protein